MSSLYFLPLPPSASAQSSASSSNNLASEESDDSEASEAAGSSDWEELRPAGSEEAVEMAKEATAEATLQELFSEESKRVYKWSVGKQMSARYKDLFNHAITLTIFGINSGRH